MVDDEAKLVAGGYKTEAEEKTKDRTQQQIKEFIFYPFLFPHLLAFLADSFTFPQVCFTFLHV